MYKHNFFESTIAMYSNCPQTKAVIKTILDESTLIESYFCKLFQIFT